MEFPEGIKIFKPREQAPSFVKGQIVINVNELGNWLHQQNSDMVRLDCLESKPKPDGSTSYYLKVNDYKPKQKEEREEVEEDIVIPGTEGMF